MRTLRLIPAVLAIAAQAVNIVISNDDGFAEINVRSLYKSLSGAGCSCVLSAPADNKSGTGSLDLPATPRTSPCEFDTCPVGSPPVGQGTNDTDPRISYVNSYPVTSIKYGISTLGPQFFGGSKPDLAVSGFNVGANLGLVTFISGTVGAATEAAKQGIPAIAFSGATGTQTAYFDTLENYVKVYTELATNLTQAVVNSGAPYLPENTYLNVNFSESEDDSCTSALDFKFVLSRVTRAILLTPPDVDTCGSTRLPKEEDVIAKAGCYVSISVGNAVTKLDSTAVEQQVVLSKLKSILTCL